MVTANASIAASVRQCWLRGGDLNPRPLGYEPNELPDCSTPRHVIRCDEDRSTIDGKMPSEDLLAYHIFQPNPGGRGTTMLAEPQELTEPRQRRAIATLPRHLKAACT